MQSTLEKGAHESICEEMVPLLDEAMARLRQADRDALVLRYFENKSLQEVGAALGLQERAAQKRVTRSLEKLRGLFLKRGLALSTGAIAIAVSECSVRSAPAGLTVSALAAAKGTAVPASTLTLVQGASQAIAWAKMKTMLLMATVAAPILCIPFVVAQFAAPKTMKEVIIEISIPVQSQNPFCRPSYDNIWTVAAPPFPFATAGIGIIVKPVFVPRNDNRDFALHQNDTIQPSPLYAAPHVPDPALAIVTYKFDRPQIVSGVEVIQHQNGVTRLEGLLGNSTNTMVSIGSVFGPSGDLTSGVVVPKEGDSQVFNFGNASVAGTVFQVIVRKTIETNGFAVHRVFPLDANGARIGAASAPTTVAIQKVPARF